MAKATKSDKKAVLKLGWKYLGSDLACQINPNVGDHKI